MKKSLFSRWWFWVIVVIFYFIFSSIGKSEKAQTPQTTPDNGAKLVGTVQPFDGNTGVKKDPETFGPGDQVELNGVVVTFNGITETRGSGYYTAPDNKIFVIAEFTVENNTGKDINISSVFGSDAYVDDYKTEQSMEAELGDPMERHGLTGTIAPGKKLNGIIGYEVSSQWQELEIRLKTDWYEGSRADVITFVAVAG